MSFEVLHMYVDGIWVKKKGCEEQDDFLPLLHEIAERTALPIALDSVYRWVAFLPARADRRMSVPNRYFGVKQDGSLTVRGIEIRKHDSAPYIVRMQKNMLGMLESAANLDELRQRLPEVLQLVLRRYRKLKAGKVALQDLVVRKRMGKDLDAYRVPSPAAIAARQLENIGSPAQSGKRVPLVYTLGKPGVCAWHARIPIDPRSVNYAYYCRLLIRAGEAVLHPLGVDEDALQAYLQGKGVVQMSLELGRLSPEILS
jgi:DNA polymerase-2